MSIDGSDIYWCGVRKAKTFHQDTYAVSTQFTDVTPPNGLNGVVARPKRFELLTPDSRLVPVSEIRTILISDFCSGSFATEIACPRRVRFYPDSGLNDETRARLVAACWRFAAVSYVTSYPPETP